MSTLTIVRPTRRGFMGLAASLLGTTVLTACSQAQIDAALARIKDFVNTLATKVSGWVATIAPDLAKQIQDYNSKVQAIVSGDWKATIGGIIKSLAPLVRQAISLATSALPIPKVAVDAALKLLDFLANFAGLTSLRPGQEVPSDREADEANLILAMAR